jgi:hypothetical protein
MECGRGQTNAVCKMAANTEAVLRQPKWSTERFRLVLENVPQMCMNKNERKKK